jgi:hypothetical protein
MVRKPAIPGIQDARRAGNLGCRIDRPGPPDLARKIHDAVATRISRSNSAGGKFSRAAARGSCNAARPKPRPVRVLRNRRASEVHTAQSRSKKTRPREARIPFVSVISVIREIISHQKKRRAALTSFLWAPSGAHTRLPVGSKWSPHPPSCGLQVEPTPAFLWAPSRAHTRLPAGSKWSPHQAYARNSLRIPPRSFTIPFIAPGERFRNSSNNPLIRTINSSNSSMRSRA